MSEREDYADNDLPPPWQRPSLHFMLFVGITLALLCIIFYPLFRLPIKIW